jgi:hypothetical protein
MRSRTFKLQRFKIQKNEPYEKILLKLARKAEEQEKQNKLTAGMTKKDKRVGAE